MGSVQMVGLCPEAQRLQSGTPQPDRCLGQLGGWQIKLFSGWSLGLGEGTHSYKPSGATPAACTLRLVLTCTRMPTHAAGSAEGSWKLLLCWVILSTLLSA